jgi:hypothetical protein
MNIKKGKKHKYYWEDVIKAIGKAIEMCDLLVNDKSYHKDNQLDQDKIKKGIDIKENLIHVINLAWSDIQRDIRG